MSEMSDIKTTYGENGDGEFAFFIYQIRHWLLCLCH